MQPDKAATCRAALPVPAAWPNGSGVFTIPADKMTRAELGRVVREGKQCRVWQRTASGYVDRGLVPSQVAGINALGEPPPSHEPPSRQPGKPGRQKRPARRAVGM